MKHRRRLAFAALAAAAFLALPAIPGSAQDAPKEGEAAEAPKEAKEPRTEAVRKGPFSVTLDVGGTFDARQSWDVMADTEQWGGELEVVEAATPGPVEKGAVLMKFKTDKIDEAIAAAERDLTLARIGFQRQTEDMKRAEEVQAMNLRKAEVDAQTAEAWLKRYVEVERDLRMKEADQRLQNTRESVAEQEEEIRQLEKMYKADELTEETEDIVLRRAKRQLERMKFGQNSQVLRDEYWRKQEFPREQENIEIAAKKATAEYAKAKALAEAVAVQQKTEFEKARTALAKQEENFGKLKRDREKFVLTAPEAGLAVYGQLSKGKWAWSDVPSASLIAQGRMKVKPNQVLWTIVRPGEVNVRTGVGEAAVLSVADGQAAKVRPGAAPKLSLAAKVARVARVTAGAEYEVILDVEKPDPRILPGQSCKVTITTLEKAEALTVPAAAVETDGDKRFVHVWEGGKASRREVEAGETGGGRTEILSGVKEGERVLAAAPKAK
jgi:multidrug resistance efflux pump